MKTNILERLKVLTFLLLLFTANLSNAKSLESEVLIVKGKVVDPEENPIPFAKVALINLQDSSLISGSDTDSDGFFQIKLEDTLGIKQAILRIRSFDYEDQYIQVDVTFNASHFVVVKPIDNTMELEEVSVKAMRNRVKHEGNETTLYVENTLQGSGQNTIELLSKVPGVWIDQNGEITLNGKSGIQVRMNGQLLYLKGDELIDFLSSLPAESIEKIKVNPTPDASVDGEGVAGLIDIKTLKQRKNGYKGNVYSNFHYNGGFSTYLGSGIHYKAGNFAFNGSVSLSEQYVQRDIFLNNEFFLNGSQSGLVTINNVHTSKRRNIPLINISSNYKFKNRAEIEMSLNYHNKINKDQYHGLSRSENFIQNEYFDIDFTNNRLKKTSNYTVNTYFTLPTDTLGSELSINLDYVDLQNEEISTFSNQFSTSSTQFVEILRSDLKTNYDVLAAQIDYKKILNDKKYFEFGFKFNGVKSDNTNDIHERIGDDFFYDSERSHQMDITERIQSAYVSYGHQLQESTRYSLGLRTEYSDLHGKAKQVNESFHRNRILFLPSFSLNHSFSDDYSLSIGASRRVTRPRYIDVSPFLLYLDPYSYALGNPSLRPHVSNVVNVSQTFKKKYNLTTSFDYSNGYIAEVPIQDPTSNVTVFSKRNIDELFTLSSSLSIPLKIRDWWQASTNVIGKYDDFRWVLDGETLTNTQFTYTLQTIHNFALDKDYKIQFLAAYKGPVAYAMYHIDKQWWINLSVSKSFFNNNFQIALKATDIFRSDWLRGKSNINGNTTDMEQYLYSQSIRINLKYNFSKGNKVLPDQKLKRLDVLDRL